MTVNEGTPEEWRDIPGYDGAYQVSWDGRVRSFRYRGKIIDKPHYLTPYEHDNSKRHFFKLSRSDGKAADVPITRIMANAWLGGCPKGKVIYHINGNIRDDCVANIGFITRQKLGKKSGAKGMRRPVAKIDCDGNVVDFYSSAREAAKANYISRSSVTSRCNKKVKNPYNLDGYDYVWESEVDV